MLKEAPKEVDFWGAFLEAEVLILAVAVRWLQTLIRSGVNVQLVLGDGAERRNKGYFCSCVSISILH